MNRRALLSGAAGVAAALAGCLGGRGVGPGADAPREERLTVLRAYRSGLSNAADATESLRAGVELSLDGQFQAAEVELQDAEERGYTGERKFTQAMEAAGELGASTVATWSARGRSGAALLEASASTEKRHIRAVREGDTEIADGARAVSSRAARRAVKTLEETPESEQVGRRLGL